MKVISVSQFRFRTMLSIGTLAMLSTACTATSEPVVEYEEHECLMNGLISNEAGSYPAEDAKVAQTIQTEGTDPRALEVKTGYVFAAVLTGEESERTLTIIVPFDRNDIVVRVEDGTVQPMIKRADLIDATSLGDSLNRTGEWNFPESGGIGNIEGEVIVSQSEVMTLDLFMICPDQW